MNAHFHSRDDPHWELVLTIAEALLIDGIYIVELDSAASREWVDVQWSLREAGRVFGLKTRVHTRKTPDPRDRTVTMTVTRDDLTGELTVNARARLEALLRAVDDEFLRSVEFGSLTDGDR
jgi:hypothetical protein